MTSSDKSIDRSYFSTHALKPDERYQAWQESIGVVFDYELDERVELETFNAEIESYLIGNMMSADCQSNSGHWYRKSKSIAQDGLDLYMIQIFLDGQWEIEKSNGLTNKAKTGDLVILDLSQPKKTWTTDFRNLTLCIPRTSLEPLLKFPNDQNGRIIPGEHPMARLLANHMMTLHEQSPIMSLEEANSISQPTVELIATVLNATFDKELPQNAQQISNARVTQIKRFIAQNLNNPELNAELICKELRLSRATLYRLSAPLDGIQNFIKRQRLRNCFNDLLDAKLAHINLLGIALRWGFNDSSSFSRAFKAEFGITPRDLRAEGQNPNTIHTKIDTTLEVGDRQYESWLSHML